MERERTWQGGIPLTDVFVAIGVMVLLIAIMLPSIQKVRVAAARMECQNNLKQLGLAIQNYQDANSHFPPGTMPNPDLPPEQRLSFQVAIYPYVEASNLYSRVAKAEPWDSPTNAALLAEGAPKVYLCPSAPRTQDLPSAAHLAVTNYVGVAGVGSDAATRPADAPGIGVFGYDRTIKPKDVKDGLANTAMLFETGRDVGPWIRGGPATIRAVGEDAAAFGGTHFRPSWIFQTRTNGFNAVLADGSVRFVRPDTDPAILAALATIAGREELPADW